MKRDAILRCSAMPVGAPSYGFPPFTFSERAALTVQYASEPDAIRQALPEPLEPDGEMVSVSIVEAAESPFGAYRACTISLSARLEGRPVSYSHENFADQDELIHASREIWGLPAANGSPELVLGENRVAGVLNLGYVGHIRISIPVPEQMDTDTEAGATEGVSCKLIPGTDGTPAVAQLISLTPTDVSVRESWSGPAQLEADPGGPLDSLPIKNVLTGRYVLGDMTLPYGRVVHDYLAAKG